MRIPQVPPSAFTLSAVFVGFLLVDNATPNEQNALGNWLMLVSQYLCTNAAYGQLLQSNSQTPGSFNENNSNSQNNPSTEDTIQMLKKMADAMNTEIENLKKSL